MLRLRLSLVLILLLLTTLSPYASGTQQVEQLVYAAIGDDATTIRIVNLGTYETRSVSIANYQYYALSNEGKRLAYVDSSDVLFVLDLVTFENIKVASGIYSTFGYFYDVLSIDSRSLLWSPDGNRLAYHAQLDGAVHVFVYDVERNSASLLTGALGHFQNWISISSWSSDSQWLSVVFSATGSHLDWTLALLSLDGQDAITTPMPGCTRAYWSPSMRYLVTSDSCLSFTSHNSQISIVKVDFVQQVASIVDMPLDTDRDDSLFIDRREPRWIDYNVMVYERNFVPYFGQAGRVELVEASVLSQEYRVIAVSESNWPDVLGTWRLTNTPGELETGIDTSTGRKFPPIYYGDAILHFAKISPSQRLLAVRGGYHDAGQLTWMRVFDIESTELVFQRYSSEDLWLIGFIDCSGCGADSE